MNYVTNNGKITKMQIEKIRKKAVILPLISFSFFPIHESIMSHL